MRAIFVVVVFFACSGPPKPDAVSQLLDVFETHSIVALDEGGHGNELVHAFLERVIRDPRMQGIDLVVEFGTARHQDLVDRYVRGEDVPDVRRVWQETTQVLVWDAPVYERFFRTVREVNATRPLRVVLGDPPIDWSTVATWSDWTKYKRDAHAADVVEREVLARGRKALVIYGGSHVSRRNIQVNYAPSDRLVELLAKRHPGKVFNIYASPVDVGGEPRLIRLSDDPIGRRDFAQVLGDAAPQRRFDETTGKPVDPSQHAVVPFAEVFDALLYLGPSATYSEPVPAVLADEAYYRELVRRSRVLDGMALDQIETLRAKAVQ